MSDAAPKRKPFRRFFYRGIEVHKLLDLTHAELMKLMHARVRRRYKRGYFRHDSKFMEKLRKAKKAAPTGMRPATVNTHLRNKIVMPEMVGSVVGVYNGKQYNEVEIKPMMIGHYLGEFSITYKPVGHGKGANMGSKLIPLR